MGTPIKQWLSIPLFFSINNYKSSTYFQILDHDTGFLLPFLSNYFLLAKMISLPADFRPYPAYFPSYLNITFVYLPNKIQA
jgi:hypothetical protein